MNANGSDGKYWILIGITGPWNYGSIQMYNLLKDIIIELRGPTISDSDHQ